MVVYDLPTRAHKLLVRQPDFPATVRDECCLSGDTSQQEINVRKKRALIEQQQPWSRGGGGGKQPAKVGAVPEAGDT